ncbi:MAG: NTP transferase domain-containing protein, partial [Helicobacter sp.]|nr:NTP transferase domain-containing protein [Helicobacter sp.]
MKAIILAAGEGKRLRPLTLNKPKPLLEIRGKSILENTIDYLQQSGIKDIIVLTGYKHQLFDELQKKLNFQQIVFKDYQGVNSAE